MTAIITASRESELVIAGVPLLLRAVLSAQRAGIGRVIVVCDGDPERARTILDRDQRARDTEIVAPDRLDPAIEGPVLRIAGDCLVTVRSLQAVATRRKPCPGGDLGGCRDLPSGASGDLPSPGEAPTESFIRVRSAADIPHAEAALIAELRAATLDTDGPIARVDRTLSLQLSRWLVRTSLRPNHITSIGTIIGLLAALALAEGSYWYALLGASLFWVAIIIDGCDGEVARLKFLETRFGQLFDVITDNIVHVAIFAGLAVGAYRMGRIEQVLPFVAILIAGFLCASAATYFCLLSDGPIKHLETNSPRARVRRRALHAFEALMNRDFAYLLVLLAIIDRLHWFLWGTVFGTYGYGLGLVWVYRWNDDTRPAHRPGSAVESPH